MKEVAQSETLERRLSRLELPEARYRVDLDLHDRSLAFSAELLRLALAGIAVIGFILTRLPEQRMHLVFDDIVLKGLLSGGLVALAATAGSALLHRFYAGGAAFHHLQVIKVMLLNDASDEEELSRELRERTRLFMRCHRFLTTSSICLVASAALLGGAFIRLLFA
jgi:hypothetical protein